jgi:cytidine deaminase
VASAELEQAKKLALAPISNFLVGAVAVGASGRRYGGFNLEFTGLALDQTVHAEQAAVVLAHSQGEQRLVSLLTSAPPCGFCRQFLREIQTAPWPQVAVADSGQLGLDHWLPQSFGPQDLAVGGGLLEVCQRLDDEASLEELAGSSWSPYSRTRAAVAVRAGGRRWGGCYLENAAFNPSLSPLQYALIRLRAQGLDWSDIESIEFWESPGPVSLRPCTESLAKSLGHPLR